MQTAGRNLFLLGLFYLVWAWPQPVLGQSKRLLIQFDAAHKQLAFAGEEIRQEAIKKGYTVRIGSVLAGKLTKETTLQINLIADSVVVAGTSREAGLKIPERFGWQHYAIRVKRTSGQTVVYVLASDPTGAMYGGLDVAEAIRQQSLSALTDSDNAPYLERRGIKFNIPLDVRTPSYSDPGDASQQNMPDVWQESFWQTYFEEMAKNRYNTLTLWSLHPFPSLIKVPEFPDVALSDVWRTKATFDDSYSFTGVNFVRPHVLKNVEVIKKMTIEQKIDFWRKIMQIAQDHGIEVYIFTWNLFTYGAEGKHGITDRQTNDTTIAYFRATMREMVTTYPLLAGIGITAGEHMDNKLKGDYANEKWLWRTYGEGIRDGLKKSSGRNFRLIHRFHYTSLGAIQEAFSAYPSVLELSMKYAIAHMYSIPNPPFVQPAMPFLSKQTRSWLTIRNDDIYSFRWANNTFARQFIRAIPEPEKIAGFYMGPDGYCWGRDYLTKGSEHPLVLQKQWYSFMLWGRLSYNPNLSDTVFLQNLQSRFPAIPVQKLYKPWAAASMVFPWITRYVWGDIDLKWLPEANLSHPNHHGFYTVADYIVREPMPGSGIRTIYLWAKNSHNNQPDSLLSPMAVADTLTQLAHTALSGLKNLPARTIGSFAELDQTLGDIEAFAHIGNYYAAKLKAAGSLALFDQFGNEADRNRAIVYLEQARQHWVDYARVYASLYKPALYNRVGYVNIPDLLVKVEADITLAKQWKPNTIRYETKYTTERPFRN